MSDLGFGAEGFMNGLVGGLEAYHRMHSTDEHNRLLQQEAQDRRYRLGLEAANKGYERQKIQAETEKLNHENDRNRSLDISNRLAIGGNVSDEDFDHLANKTGLPWDMIADTPKVQRLQQMTGEVVQGKRDVNDPEFQSTMADFHGYRVNNRGIGSEAVDPQTGTRIKVTSKKLIGFDQHHEDPNLFTGRIKVDGTDVKTGKPYSYTAWASRDGTSDPNDPYAFVDAKHILNANAAIVALNHRLEADPDARKRLADSLERASTNPEKRSLIDLRNAQVDTQQSQQKLNEKRGNQIDKQTETEGYRQGELSAREGYYSRGNRGEKAGTAKPPKPGEPGAPFNQDLAKEQVNLRYPQNPSLPDDEITKKRIQHFDVTRGLMNTGAASDQHEADSIAGKLSDPDSQAEIVKDRPITDGPMKGRRFNGIRFKKGVNPDGTPHFSTIPYEWLN
jgi:hypothetical protein